jgi:GAF domain-containing protein
MLRWLKSLPEKVADSLVVPLLGFVLIAVAGVLLARLDEDIPAWTALIAVVLIAAGAFALGRVRASSQEVTTLIDDLFVQVELHLYYADHIYEVLETLQKVVSGSIPDVGFDEFVERGMLEPARGYLTQASGEDVRLSVQVPDEERQNFLMRFSAGHSLEGRRDFHLPIAGSFGGHAYSSSEVQWTGDVEADPRWSKHAKARAGRNYASLVSVPVVVRDQVIGVMNVVSTYKQAFSEADRTYIELLGSILSVAWSLREGEDQGG